MTEQNNVQNFSFEEQADTIIATGIGVVAATVLMKGISWGINKIACAVANKKVAKKAQQKVDEFEEETEE